MRTDELIAMAAKHAAETRERARAKEAEEKMAHAVPGKSGQVKTDVPAKAADPEADRPKREVVEPAPSRPMRATSHAVPDAPAPVRQQVAPPPLQSPQDARRGNAAVVSAPSKKTPAQPRSPGPKVPAAAQAAAADAAQSFRKGEETRAKPAASTPIAQSAPAAVAGNPPVSPTTLSNWQEGLPTGNGKVVSKGLLFIFGFLLLFLAWAALFPISSAVVAPGKIVSVGANKLIQHPVGGVVRTIFKRDGDEVAENEIIMALDPSLSQAELTRLKARHDRLAALRARLLAEGGAEAFSGAELNDGLTGASLRGSQSAMAATEAEGTDVMLAEQRKEYVAGRKRLAAEMNAQTSQIESLRDERSGLEARLAGERRLLEFTGMEIAKVRPLATEGYLPKVRLWDLEKKRLEQVTSVGNLEANIDATTQRIAEAEAKLAQLSEADQENRSEELTRVIGEMAEIRDQIRAAQVTLSSNELRAPVAGILTKMTANTEGGVVRAGDVIVELVPKSSGLITEFRVPLPKIKSVEVGQKARIVVTAFNRRTYDPIEGEVIYVSADSELDPVTQETYFLARARLNANPDKNNGVDEVRAGMTTEVYALSTPRVFLSYVFQPISDSFNRAFRETN